MSNYNQTGAKLVYMLSGNVIQLSDSLNSLRSRHKVAFLIHSVAPMLSFITVKNGITDRTNLERYLYTIK